MVPYLEDVLRKSLFGDRLTVDLYSFLHTFQVWRGIQTNLFGVSSPVSVNIQERVRKGACAPFAFRSCHVYDVQFVNIIVLHFLVKNSYQTSLEC